MILVAQTMVSLATLGRGGQLFAAKQLTMSSFTKTFLLKAGLDATLQSSIYEGDIMRVDLADAGFSGILTFGFSSFLGSRYDFTLNTGWKYLGNGKPTEISGTEFIFKFGIGWASKFFTGEAENFSQTINEEAGQAYNLFITTYVNYTGKLGLHEYKEYIIYMTT